MIIYLVSIHKWSFCPISALCSKNNPRNINHVPAVIFFACLDIEQKSSFLDKHYLRVLLVLFKMVIGKINIGEKERISDIFTGNKSLFIVMVDVSYKENVGKTMFINKRHIVWAEPEEF